MRRRVHYLTQAKLPSRAANNVATMKMCEAFAARGCDVTLFSRAGDEGADDVFGRYGVAPSFEVVAFKQRGVRGTHLLWFLADLRRAIRRRGVPDLFYGRDLVGLCAVEGLGAPLVWETHWSIREAPVLRALFDRLHRRPGFERLVVISEALAEEYRALFPTLSPRSVVVAPSGADEPAPARPRRAPGARAGALQVGYVGHLYPGKGAETLVALAPRIPHVDVHVVGGEERDLARLRAAGAAPNLRFHGFVDHKDLPAWLAGFDVVVAPYRRQVTVSGGTDVARWMSPLKVFEYMAAEKAIVCSDLPVLREVLRDRENALLVAPDDVDGWAEAVLLLERDRALRERIARRARRDFLARYTWTTRARSVLDEAGPRAGAAAPGMEEAA